MKDLKHYVTHLMLLLLSLSSWAGKDNDTSSILQPQEQVAALSVNESIYFVAGGSDELKACFQFSFKYRILEEDGALIRKAPWLTNLHFAYTQTSLWNLSGDSHPFENSSYRESFFFYIKYSTQVSWLPSLIHTGYEHESNRHAGNMSRTLDTAYI